MNFGKDFSELMAEADQTTSQLERERRELARRKAAEAERERRLQADDAKRKKELQSKLKSSASSNGAKDSRSASTSGRKSRIDERKSLGDEKKKKPAGGYKSDFLELMKEAEKVSSQHKNLLEKGASRIGPEQVIEKKTSGERPKTSADLRLARARSRTESKNGTGKPVKVDSLKTQRGSLRSQIGSPSGSEVGRRSGAHEKVSLTSSKARLDSQPARRGTSPNVTSQGVLSKKKPDTDISSVRRGSPQTGNATKRTLTDVRTKVDVAGKASIRKETSDSKLSSTYMGSSEEKGRRAGDTGTKARSITSSAVSSDRVRSAPSSVKRGHDNDRDQTIRKRQDDAEVVSKKRRRSADAASDTKSGDGFRRPYDIDPDIQALRSGKTSVGDLIWGIFGRNKREYVGRDDLDDSDMEADMRSIQREEARSARLGRREDEDIERQEEEAEKRRRLGKKAKK
ncbi:uncharacterized protein SPPG_02284 [Spizellomyces punctatus DAOM BR117]|uniref:SPT2 chromatin protein n=1 Tax=Spizellomyces punctatus (strain DAOM BR117) TaxID=645134 RepID=A0A0L0HQJ6_SPIPD|nr:uncharacterized protein SPPG_02284 [Spizellomyces punctatus DAOM BR117]KND03230.1 hypothetical protein SPPG_02284 [Spizellomyces punctatus DAOM BR117]|eukprot:XP_016611269.1 hypothetical protein SPPG_02284 [Spizellomyces punctatus DAOM BR117]